MEAKKGWALQAIDCNSKPGGPGAMLSSANPEGRSLEGWEERMSHLYEFAYFGPLRRKGSPVENLQDLQCIVSEEPWDSPGEQMGILRLYLNHQFIRCVEEGKVVVCVGEGGGAEWACFNCGLLTAAPEEPVFAVLRRDASLKYATPWLHHAFVTLSQLREPLRPWNEPEVLINCPDPACFVDDPLDTVFWPSASSDTAARGSGLVGMDLDPGFWERVDESVDQLPAFLRGVGREVRKAVVGAAIARAARLARHNPRDAVPCAHRRQGGSGPVTVQLLLPLALDPDSGEAHLALVMGSSKAGPHRTYRALDITSLKEAYTRARLLLPVHQKWLLPHTSHAPTADPHAVPGRGRVPGRSGGWNMGWDGSTGGRVSGQASPPVGSPARDGMVLSRDEATASPPMSTGSDRSIRSSVGVVGGERRGGRAVGTSSPGPSSFGGPARAGEGMDALPPGPAPFSRPERSSSAPLSPSDLSYAAHLLASSAGVDTVSPLAAPDLSKPSPKPHDWVGIPGGKAPSFDLDHPNRGVLRGNPADAAQGPGSWAGPSGGSLRDAAQARPGGSMDAGLRSAGGSPRAGTGDALTKTAEAALRAWQSGEGDVDRLAVEVLTLSPPTSFRGLSPSPPSESPPPSTARTASTGAAGASATAGGAGSGEAGPTVAAVQGKKAGPKGMVLDGIAGGGGFSFFPQEGGAGPGPGHTDLPQAMTPKLPPSLPGLSPADLADPARALISALQALTGVSPSAASAAAIAAAAARLRAESGDGAAPPGGGAQPAAWTADYPGLAHGGKGGGGGGGGGAGPSAAPEGSIASMDDVHSLQSMASSLDDVCPKVNIGRLPKKFVEDFISSKESGVADSGGGAGGASGVGGAPQGGEGEAAESGDGQLANHKEAEKYLDKVFRQYGAVASILVREDKYSPGKYFAIISFHYWTDDNVRVELSQGSTHVHRNFYAGAPVHLKRHIDKAPRPGQVKVTTSQVRPGWRYTQKDTRSGKPLYEGPCTVCSKISTVPFRPLINGQPPKCQTCNALARVLDSAPSQQEDISLSQQPFD